MIKNILISQPEPANSPYTELVSKYGLSIDFHPFFRVEPLSAKDFRAQRINILDHTAIVFTSKATIDAFFKLCEDLRITVPETMKYFCASEGVAMYLQKYIVYRKRKISFGNGTLNSIIDAIGTKHKDEVFLIATAETVVADLPTLFKSAKLKYDTAVFVRTVNSDLTSFDLDRKSVV